MDLRIVVEKLRHLGQHRFDLLVAGTCSIERHDAYSAAKLVADSVVQLVQQQLLLRRGSWEGSAVIMCIQQFSDGSLRRGSLRVARIVIGENPSGSRSGAIAIPPDRQNRIKRCGVRARQLDYLHVMIWLLVAVSSFAQKSYGRSNDAHKISRNDCGCHERRNRNGLPRAVALEQQRADASPSAARVYRLRRSGLAEEFPRMDIRRIATHSQCA